MDAEAQKGQKWAYLSCKIERDDFKMKHQARNGKAYKKIFFFFMALSYKTKSSNFVDIRITQTSTSASTQPNNYYK